MLIKILLLAAIGVTLSFLPHHRLKADYVPSRDPVTLVQLIGQLGRDLRDASLGRGILTVLMMIAAATILFAPVLAWEIAANAPPLSPNAGSWFVLQGIVLLIAAAATFFAMLFTGWTIGFGGGHSTFEPTPILFVVSGVQLLVAVASILFGAWPAAADAMHRALA